MNIDLFLVFCVGWSMGAAAMWLYFTCTGLIRSKREYLNANKLPVWRPCAGADIAYDAIHEGMTEGEIADAINDAILEAVTVTKHSWAAGNAGSMEIIGYINGLERASNYRPLASTTHDGACTLNAVRAFCDSERRKAIDELPESIRKNYL